MMKIVVTSRGRSRIDLKVFFIWDGLSGSAPGGPATMKMV